MKAQNIPQTVTKGNLPFSVSNLDPKPCSPKAFRYSLTNCVLTLSYSIGIVCYFNHMQIIIFKPQYQSFIVTSLACMTSQAFEVAGEGKEVGLIGELFGPQEPRPQRQRKSPIQGSH